MRNGVRRDSDAKLNLLQRFLVTGDDAGCHSRRRLKMAVGHGLQTRKPIFDQIDEAVVIQVSGGRDDEIVGHKALVIEIQQSFLLERAYRLLGAENRFAERMILPEILGEYLVDQIVGVVLIHLDLFEDDALFPNNVPAIEDRIENQIAQDIHRGRQMFVEHLDVEADDFLAGERVHVATDGIHLAGNLLRRARGRALEHHMFGEMRDAVVVGGFIARSGFHPDADGNGADVIHLLTQQSEAVRQNFAADITRFDQKLVGHMTFRR